MKVLWFTNTPSLADAKLSNTINGGGWIKSLEKEIKKQSEIQLGVVFYYERKIDYFDYQNTKYFPIYNQRKSKFNNLYSRIKGKIESEKDILIFIRIINQFKPDVIHIHGSEGPFGLIQKEIQNIPIILSIQGIITVYSHKWYSGISKLNIYKYTNLLNLFLFKGFNYQLKAYNKRAIREREIFSYTKNIIGRTDWDKRISLFLSKSSKYYHLDEILRDRFYLNQWEFKKSENSTFNIFTTNGNNIYKGIEIILLTANLLDEYGFNYKWYIAGISINDMLIIIALKMYKILLSKNLIFLGNLEEEEIIENLLKANAYVMPSHIENSPNNLCEAMILGLPCIATDAGGTSTILENKKEGILIQEGDPWSLAGTILEFSNNYEKAIEYGQNARKKAIERHNSMTIVNGLINIYSDIIYNFKKK